MYRKMPFYLLLEIVAVSLLTPYLPVAVQQGLFSLSLSIKALIVFTLPLIIFGLLFKTTVNLARQATLLIGLIILLVCCSNATATFLSHYVGSWIYHFDMSILLPKTEAGLAPLWSFTLPKLLPNDKAMLSGLLFGIILGNTYSNAAQKLAFYFDRIITKLLNLVIYLIPIFIAGFIVKLQADGVITTIAKDYTVIFAIVALSQLSYISFAYLALNRFNLGNTLKAMKNMLPAALTGFSTMSSAAAMPFTIAGVKENTKNKDLASSVIPATVNIHLIGDCFAIPIFAYAVIKSFGIAEPSLMTYLTFVLYFVIAKFSVAAIPGGGIIVMLPILENYLGFNGEMLSLITALYILFDPVITCANVLGNGAFAIMIDRIQGNKITFKQPANQPYKNHDIAEINQPES